MVCIIRPIGGIDWIIAVSWIRHQDPHICLESNGKGLLNIVGGLIDEGCQLVLIGGVEQVQAKAVIRVHHLHRGQIVVSVER